jgi:phenylacetate-coenzyme A ligase PaaK-like adenylate-forming protein
MEKRTYLWHQLEQLSDSDLAFEALAMEVFHFQALHNPLYAQFLSLLRRDASSIKKLVDIPFLPISFFKSHEIKTGKWPETTVFSSSGTTGQIPSQHFVRDKEMYLDNCVRGFVEQYGDPKDWMVLALLPSYLERTGSSLVAMVDHFIQRSNYKESGFFLHNLKDLQEILEKRPKNVPVLLLGVSFALLDFAEQFPMNLTGVTIMETGGMKGRRKEMTRAELHETLCAAFQVDAIHSEYGMTELFSQGYAKEGHLFAPCATMRVQTTEINDPFCPTKYGKTGVINVIDLANIDTCSFIATEDLGKVHANGQFEVLGRLDTSEMRGCNLMVE